MLKNLNLRKGIRIVQRLRNLSSSQVRKDLDLAQLKQVEINLRHDKLTRPIVC